MTAELDAYWLAAHGNSDRECWRLPRPNWLQVHGKDEPQCSTLESPPVEPPGDVNPLALLLEVGRFDGNITGGNRVNESGALTVVRAIRR